MRIWRRRAAVAAIALGLLGGPAAVACTACCPTSDVASIVDAPACCGDCAPGLSRSPEPASAVIQSVAAAFPSLLAEAPAVHERAPLAASRTCPHVDVRVRSGPGSASTPLRL
jgi:hypothetical protein